MKYIFKTYTLLAKELHYVFQIYCSWWRCIFLHINLTQLSQLFPNGKKITFPMSFINFMPNKIPINSIERDIFISNTHFFQKKEKNLTAAFWILRVVFSLSWGRSVTAKPRAITWYHLLPGPYKFVRFFILGVTEMTKNVSRQMRTGNASALTTLPPCVPPAPKNAAIKPLTQTPVSFSSHASLPFWYFPAITS